LHPPIPIGRRRRSKTQPDALQRKDAGQQTARHNREIVEAARYVHGHGPTIIITTRIFLRVVHAYDVDPVHFGVIMILD